MIENDRFPPRNMWNLTTELARLKLLEELRVAEDPDFPFDEFAMLDYDELPLHVCGRLIVAETPDGWNPQAWHDLKNLAVSRGATI